MHFANAGKLEMLLAGYWTPGHVRHRSFEQEFLRRVPGGTVTYVHLQDQNSPAELYHFSRRFCRDCAVFSTDYAANHTVAPYSVACTIEAKDSIMVFDSEETEFVHPGLAPVRAAASPARRRTRSCAVACNSNGTPED